MKRFKIEIFTFSSIFLIYIYI